MAFWTLFGLAAGKATTDWPRPGGDDGQSGLLGMPRHDPAMCDPDCQACIDVCPTAAITRGAGEAPLAIDYGRCIACQLCTEVCPTGAMQPSSDWAFGVREREDLRLNGGSPFGEQRFPLRSRNGVPANGRPGKLAVAKPRPNTGAFHRSLHVRHVDAGSDNACESELQALNNPFYNLHRLGIFFTPSPRAADLLLVTGAVTNAMLEPLKATYVAMPEPRWVMAVGTDAVSGGIAEGGYACGHGLDSVLPVDLYLPGSPPNPAAIIEALLVFLNRLPQRAHGGRIAL